jgi:hypothetical protein
MEIGDKVQWTEKRIKNRTLSMESKTGTVDGFLGDDAIVKKANGRKAVIPASWLRGMGEPTEIHDFIAAMREVRK